MIIEIGYSFQADKSSPARQSWTYFYVKGDDFTKAKPKAKKYFTQFAREHGWTRKAKVTHIKQLSKANEAPTTILVNSAELPAARKRRSTPQLAKVRSKTRKVSGNAKLPL